MRSNTAAFLEAAQTLRPQYSISLSKLMEASATVFLTTLEDCVWLIPFVARAPSASIALAHGLLFIITLVGISVATSALAFLIDSIVKTDNLLILEAIGATICWLLAGFFFYQAYLKELQRRRRDTDSLRDLPSSIRFSPMIDHTSTNNRDYGAFLNTTDDNCDYFHRPPTLERMGSSLTGPIGEDDTDLGSIGSGLNGNGHHHLEAPGAQSAAHAHVQPWVIISLTLLGSLDEVSYFPALIVGQIFTAAEVVIGTLIATLMILGLVDILTRRCSFCLLVLDQVPLYAVISVFASILSLEVLLDLAEWK